MPKIKKPKNTRASVFIAHVSFPYESPIASGNDLSTVIKSAGSCFFSPSGDEKSPATEIDRVDSSTLTPEYRVNSKTSGFWKFRNYYFFYLLQIPRDLGRENVRQSISQLDGKILPTFTYYTSYAFNLLKRKILYFSIRRKDTTLYILQDILYRINSLLLLESSIFQY